jgi:branched-chain amino acid transport system substrate-binding protein
VLASIGPSSGIVSASTAPIFLESKVPDVSAIGDSGPLNPYLFSLFPISGQGVIATDLVKARNFTKFGVIVQAGPLAESTRRVTTPDFEKLMEMVAYEQIQPTDTDLTSVMAKIRSAGAELMLIPMTGQQAALAARNFKQINYPGVLVVTAQNANAAFIDLVSEAADVTNVIGTKIFIYQDLPDSDPSKAVLTDFANKFTSKTGRPATLVANVGWDMMLSLTEAIKTAGTDREKIREALENQKGLKTLTGTINRTAQEHNGMEADWILMGIDAANKRFVLKK